MTNTSRLGMGSAEAAECSNMQEDLAALLSRNLSLSANPLAASSEAADHYPWTDEAQIPQNEPTIKYSASQHYHHSAHLATTSEQPSVSGAEPSMTEGPLTDDSTVEIILSRHGIDPTVLLPAQLTLFRQADTAQQMRLVELWRINPSGPGDGGLALGYGQATAFEQELNLARLHRQRELFEEGRMGGQGRPADSDVAVCGNEMRTVAIEGGDGRNLDRDTLSEPYIVSGYEVLARREYDQQGQSQAKQSYAPFGSAVGGQWPSEGQPRSAMASADPQLYSPSVDPVYQGPEMWRKLVGQQDVACQYGAFDQVNQFGGLGAAPEVVIVHGSEDEEML
ncbi:MAG: hypothetical protein M1832_005985 [Thelocarpon impressellum]|nr:MAG: hypothetical protein M1832_005985 [Thelocarpon impressellum]